MPGFNHTGPVGRGPMTGWKMGRCTNFGAGQKKEEVVAGSQVPEETIHEDMRGKGSGRCRGGLGRGRGGFGGGRQNRFRGGW